MDFYQTLVVLRPCVVRELISRLSTSSSLDGAASGNSILKSVTPNQRSASTGVKLIVYLLVT